jgi:hypothetical protein
MIGGTRGLLFLQVSIIRDDWVYGRDLCDVEIRGLTMDDGTEKDDP